MAKATVIPIPTLGPRQSIIITIRRAGTYIIGSETISIAAGQQIKVTPTGWKLI